MHTDNAPAVLLKDYTPPPALIDTVQMTFDLHPTQTRVCTRMALRPNPEAPYTDALFLVGDGIGLERAPEIDGQPLPPEQYKATAQGLTLFNPPKKAFSLQLDTLVNPSANTQLMGLYRSSGNYCTQCEAEGFRRITYFLDRPDVLSSYIVRIEASKSEAPVLLANGNPIESGDIAGTDRHYAVWHDPYPKPSYLFALVAGNLTHIEDCFTTSKGSEVKLAIYIEHGKENHAHYAMDALKRSMRWDEVAFGRAYDLEIFNIVAVSDFNMGAMENKGLNVFNDKYVLASPETATDSDYAGIESVIAHEYFHNWTGNRITCRDWFQLCLKEGLTVFRDQEFTADERSRPVKRIADVKVLRGHQFTEDAGPFAHAVRPEMYREINNFYTATIYEKGAELIRMLQVLLGKRVFRASMDLYFERHDGQACTMEDFIACFAEVSGKNLEHFMLWYAQAGTPHVTVDGLWDQDKKTYTLKISQETPATPGQPHKSPLYFPLKLGLIDHAGNELPLVLKQGERLHDGIIIVDHTEQTYIFTNIAEKPVLSINREFSAPVKIISSQPDAELLHLAGFDKDAFNRWQAVQTYMLRHIKSALSQENKQAIEPAFIRMLDNTLTSQEFDPAYKAQLLGIPSESDIAQEIGQNINPDAIFAARKAMKHNLAHALHPRLVQIYEAYTGDTEYSPDAEAAGRRALRNSALDVLTSLGDEPALERALAHYNNATNMTDRMAGLSALVQIPGDSREEALHDFYERFSDNPLVIDKWFAVQACIPEEGTLERVRNLMKHPAFSLENPNRVRSLIGAFASANPTQFNRADGAGYGFIADMILALDAKNPQVAARILGAFKTWRNLEAERRHKAREKLEAIASSSSLSPDVSDLVTRALA